MKGIREFSVLLMKSDVSKERERERRANTSLHSPPLKAGSLPTTSHSWRLGKSPFFEYIKNINLDNVISESRLFTP